MTKYIPVNWNTPETDYTEVFLNQNIKQFWIDTEIPVSKDLKVWNALDDKTRETYKKVLGGLTLLDTVQGNIGMPYILQHIEGLQRKAVLTFMSMMENIHARSYSTIFTTLIPRQEINEVFEWVENNRFLQKKASVVSKYYESIKTKKDLYMALVASVYLESFLFYSGFFLPLYLAGQGKMVASGEIINLIIRDEQIHGVFVGLLAQETYSQLSDVEKEEVDKEVVELVDELMGNEIHYTDELYGSIGLHTEVKKFLKYNANKALMNLGRDTYFEEEDINPIVFNGLKTDTKTHDFFSVNL